MTIWRLVQKLQRFCDYYMALLYRLSAEIKERPQMQKKKVLYHQDNAPCDKSIKKMVKLNELSFDLLPYPPYYRDSLQRALPYSSVLPFPTTISWSAPLPPLLWDKARSNLIYKESGEKYYFRYDAIWRKVPKKSKIDFPIFDVLHRFKPALQDGVMEKILSLIVVSLRSFKHCHSEKLSRLLSHHIHIRKCCECGYSAFLSEDGWTGRTDTDYKPVKVCVLKEERNIRRALSALHHFSCFSSKIYAWLLRAVPLDHITGIDR